MENENKIPVVDEERVFVKVTETYKDLRVEKPDIPKMEPFKPIDRVIVNFKLVDPSKGNEPVTKFDPPIELWVKYTSEIMQKAEARGDPLRLAYWNGDHWVRFKEDEHNFEFKPGPGGGDYGKALISEWTDPPIAWGT